MYPQSDPQSLELWISHQIRVNGPVTFAQFMDWALYHPHLGYYSAGPNIGPRGDFVTSPEASPVFGFLLARHVREIDRLLGQPEHFDVIECGPGLGTLAADLLDALQIDDTDLYGRLRYWLVDVSPALVNVQQKRLLPIHAEVVEWRGSLKEIPQGRQGAVIANEVVDAFPVHIVENVDGKLVEQYVGLDSQDKLAFVSGMPSDTQLGRFLEEAHIDLFPGERVEVNLAAAGWVAEVAQALDNGVVTVIDYGDLAPERYSPSRREGTLLGYYGGAVTADLLAHPGDQDLTALVDFTDLKRSARRKGFDDLGIVRQANFLIGLGLGSEVTPENMAASVDEAIQHRRGLQALISMEGLGRFHVLLLSKGCSIERGGGLSGLKYKDL